MAHKWALWLHNPRRLGGLQQLRAGGGGGRKHKWRTSWLGGYITPANQGVPKTS